MRPLASIPLFRALSALTQRMAKPLALFTLPLCLVSLFLVPAPAQAAQWMDVATISSTLGNNLGRLCVGGTRTDLGCPLNAPQLNGTMLTVPNDLRVTGNFYVSGSQSFDGVTFANGGISASALTINGQTVAGGVPDRIVSTSSNIIAGADGLIRFSTGSVSNTAYLSSLGVLVAPGVSTTGPISATTGYFGVGNYYQRLYQSGTSSILELKTPNSFVTQLYVNENSQLNLVNASTRMVMNSNGAIGINTADPSTSLSVSGTIKMSDGAEACDASRLGAMKYSSGSFYICRNTTTGWESIVANSTGNAQADRITSGTTLVQTNISGTVEVSTTGFYINSNNNNETPLKVGSGTGNHFAYMDLVGDSTYPAYGLRVLRGNTGANATSLIQHRGTGEFGISTLEAAPITFGTTSLERLRIDPTGNVGIGLNGNTASATLNVSGTIQVNMPSAAGGGITIKNGGMAMALTHNQLYSSNTPLYLNYSSTQNTLINPNGGSVGVGFGGTPSATLHVSGTLKIANGGEACDANRLGAIKYTSPDFYVCRNGTTWESFTSIATGAAALADRITSSSQAGVTANATGYISLTTGGITGTVYFKPTGVLVNAGVSTTGTISGTDGYISGRLGIGTASPSATLHIINSNLYENGVIVTTNSGTPLSLFSDGNNGINFGGADGQFQTGLQTSNRSLMMSVRTGGNLSPRVYADETGVSIFNTAPTVALTVSGTIQIADSGQSCDASRLGAIKYTSSTFSICRNSTTGWETLTAGSATGATTFASLTDVSYSAAGFNVYGPGSLTGAKAGTTYNTAYGHASLASGSNTGTLNTAIGAVALRNNTSGNNNTALGAGAMNINTTGSNNLAIGVNALVANNADGNLAIGNNALYTNITGNTNLAIGSNALRHNTGNANTAVAYNSAFSLITGHDNVVFGPGLYNATNGSYNTSVGNYALNSVPSVTGTVAIGYNAGAGTVASSFQNATLLGSYAGQKLTTGSSNTLVGYNAGGGITTGANNIVIGTNLSPFSNTGDNQLNIANSIFGDTGAPLATRIGINVTSPTANLEVSGTVSATRFVGDGSGLTNISASAISGLTSDRITSGTSAVIVNSATGIISFTTNSSNSAYITGAGEYIARNLTNGTGGTRSQLRNDGALILTRPTDASAGTINGYIDFYDQIGAANFGRFTYNTTAKLFTMLNATSDANLLVTNIQASTGTATGASLATGKGLYVNGTPTVSTQGGYLGWNVNVGDGRMYFMNQRGAGGGGFVFNEYDSTNAYASTPLQTLGGRVGINMTSTSAPNTQLEVSGTLKIADSGESCATATLGAIKYTSGAFYICKTAGSWDTLATSGNVVTDRITSGTTSMITYNNTSATIATAGIERVIVGTDGQVGIGQQPASTQALSVSGSTTLSAALNVGGSFQFNTTTPRYLSWNGTGGTYLYGDPVNKYLVIATSGTEAMRIVSNGMVGIGTGAGAPSATLHVVGPAGSQLMIGANTNGNSGITWGSTVQGGQATIQTDSAHSMIFSSRNGGTIYERMRFHWTGNNGFGTSNPQTFLDVSGTLRISSTAETCDANRLGAIKYAAGQFYICRNTTTGWETLATGTASGTIVTDRITSGTTSAIAYSNTSLSLVTAGTERMVIGTTGEIGIAQQPVAGYALSISGTTGITGRLNLATATGNNVLVGSSAGLADANTSANVTAVGYQAGQTAAANNATLLGYQAGQATTGGFTTAIGGLAGQFNTGSDATFVGYNAGTNNTNYYVTGVGKNAAQNNSGNNVTAVGVQSAQNNTGSYLTAVGVMAAQSNTQGNLTAIGYQAAQLNTGQFTTAVGYTAAQNNTQTGVSAFGYAAAASNNQAGVTAVGSSAAQFNTGYSLIAVGGNAGQFNTGGYTTAIGNQAAQNNTAQNLTALGRTAAQFNTATNVTALGYNAVNTGVSNTFTNVTGLGYNAQPTKNNQIMLGDTNIAEVYTYGAGIFNQYIRPGSSPTVSLPSAATAGAGAIMYDTTSATLAFSNGTTWQPVGAGISTGATSFASLTDVSVSNTSIFGPGSKNGALNTGPYNVALGAGALSNSSNTGSNNTSIGTLSLNQNTFGNFNSAVGSGALNANQGGSNNAAFGGNAGLMITSGSNNTLIGIQAGNTITTGSSNTVIGYNINPYSNTGSNQLNIANAIWGNIGSGLGNANLIGINVTSPTANLEVSGTVSATRFVGDGSGLTGIGGATDRITSGTTQAIAYNNTSLSLVTAGTERMVIGTGGGIGINGQPVNGYQLTVSGTARILGKVYLQAPNNNLIIGDTYTAGGTGSNNIAIGQEVMQSATGNYGTNVGYAAGKNNTRDYTVLLGSTSGFQNTGDKLIALGDQSGYANTGDYSILLGFNSGRNNTGLRAIGIGFAAGQYNTGSYLTAIGSSAALYNTGNYNIALGSNAMSNHSSGAENTAVGYQSGLGVSNTSTYARNTLVGAYSGLALTSGSSNTLIGWNTGAGITTGSGNIVLGAYTSPYSNSGDNQLNIGNAIFGNIGSGLGNANLIGINVASPTANLEVSGTISATRFVGDGSGLTGIGGATDRITSNSTFVRANIGGTVEISGTTFINSYGTNDARVAVGAGPSGNRNSYIDLIGDTTYTSYGLRIIRDNAGPNGGSWLDHHGTGALNFYTHEAAPIVLSTSSTEAMRITPAGLVGIGITTPSQTLDVSGSVRLSGTRNGVVIQDRAGSTATSYTTIYRSGDITRIWDPIGTDRLAINNLNGNVGIGTTTPETKLDVYGSSLIKGDSNYTLDLLTSHDLELRTSLTNRRLMFGGNGYGYSIQSFENTTSNTNSLSLNPLGGYVGIGTSNPSTSLQVSGTIRIADGYEPCDTNRLGSIKYTGGTFYVCKTAGAWDVMTTSGAGTANDRITSGTTQAIAYNNTSLSLVTAGTERMVIGTGGYVGIAQQPVTGIALSVSGSAKINSNFDYGLLNITANNNTQTLALFQNAATRTLDGGNSTATIRNDAGDLRLQGAGGYNNDLGLRVQGSTGYVAIGTSSPTAFLHIYNASNTGTASDNTGEIIHSANRNTSLRMVAGTGWASTIYFRKNDPNSTDGQGSINYDTSSQLMSFSVSNTNATSSTAAMNINSLGYIGVGVANPTEPLQVSSTGRLFVGNEVPGGRRGLLFAASWNNELSGTSPYTRISSYDYGANHEIPLVINPFNQSTVGIGVIAPSTTLHVNGSIRLGVENSSTLAVCDTNRAGTIKYDTGAFYTCDGTTGWKTLGAGGSSSGDRIISGTTQAIAYQNTSLSLVTAGTERMVIGTNGTVGIGQQPTTRALSVSGTVAVAGTSSGLTIFDRTATNNVSYSVIYRSGDVTSIWDPAGNDRLSINNTTGYVGIGTANPNYNLTVSGTGNAAGMFLGTTGGYMNMSRNFNNTATVTDTLLGSFGFSGENTNPGQSGTAGYMQGYVDGTGGARVKGRLIFATSDGSSVNEAMRITSAGNVGIGTTTPKAPLVVSGTSWLGDVGGGATYAAGRLMVYKNGGYDYPATTGTSDSAVITRFSGGIVALDYGVANNGNGWLQQRRIDDFSANYALAINPNGGAVGIGTNSPTTNLDVSGTLRIRDGFQSCATATLGAMRYDGTNFLVCRNVATGWETLGTSSGSAGASTFASLTDVSYTATGNSIFGPGSLTGAAAGATNATAFGVGALSIVSNSGTQNSAFGRNALLNNNIGSYNTAAGVNALANNSSGTNNTGLGVGSLYANLSGSFNTGVGRDVGQNNKLGSYNTLMGMSAGYGTAASNYSGATLLGAYAGTGLTTGGSNTLIGYNAGGGITTGTNNLVLGAQTTPYSNTGSNQLNIANAIWGDFTSGAGNANRIGINVASPTTALEVSGTIKTNAAVQPGNSDQACSGTADYGKMRFDVTTKRLYLCRP